VSKLSSDTITLDPVGTWPKTKHVFDQQSKDAIRTACDARRPLLIRGEPGVGKSQLARAAAQIKKRLFVSVVVNSRTESSDLLYHFDAIDRLADAQAATAKEKNDPSFLNPKNYISPGPMWWVFDYGSAKKALETSKYKNGKPPITPKKWEWKQEDGAVILIDEIDKAETDLPNDLLETFGNGGFPVPHFDQPITLAKPVEGDDKQANHPLIIITTNDERELPAAFVRRCVVLHLGLPKDDVALKKWLIDRGKVHFEAEFDDKVSNQSRSQSLYAESADLLIKNRNIAESKGVPLVGQAEYLDLLRALKEIDPDKRRQALNDISQYVLKKYPEML
jgi:MoxR-like ATPase